jgi:uncharacterized protein (TIGR03435 family)
MRARSRCYHVALVILAVAGLSAQAGPGSRGVRLEADHFEVVSVKPTQPGSRGGPGPFVNTEPGRLAARGTLGFFIEYAYGINGSYLEGGPDWIRSDRFDIDARQPSNAQSFATMTVMMRTALADRFRLGVHRETRQVPVLLLTVARGGPKLTRSALTDEPETRGRPGELIATKISMAGLASQLSRSLGRVVQDRTRLDGFYNITLRATNDVVQGPDRLGRTPVDPDAPSLGTALEEQLGLKLESGRGPVEFLIIDRAERPGAD